MDLGTAATYSVLGGESVTNTADAHALQAQSDLGVAYDEAAAQAPDWAIVGDLGGQTLLPGVHTASSSAGLTGAVTLDAQGDPDAVFVFQIASALTTATSSSVVPINGARSCNVFWQIGSSATIGTSTSFVGTIMAQTSVTVNTSATVYGRALARTGSVTLDSDVFTGGACETPTAPPATSTPTTSGPPTTGTPTTSGPPSSTTPPSTTGTPPGSGPPSTSTLPAGTARGGGPNGGGSLAATGAGPIDPPLLAGALLALLAGLALIGSSIRRTHRRSDRGRA